MPVEYLLPVFSIDNMIDNVGEGRGPSREGSTNRPWKNGQNVKNNDYGKIYKDVGIVKMDGTDWVENVRNLLSSGFVLVARDSRRS